MSRRDSPPPPPPPPAHLRTWPDRAALLADRSLAMGELNDRLLGGKRLTLFLLMLAALHVGWAFVGGGLVSLDGVVDVFSVLFVAIGVCAGLSVMVPAVFVVARGVRQDRRLREVFARWAVLDRSPAHDARLRAPGMSLVWLLLSFLLCALGLWISFTVPASARPGETGYGEVTYFMGAGLIFWIVGLIGVTKAVGHYRLVIRLLPPVPSATAAPRGDAAR
ncbi:hypothetical protein [Streptomyces sp. SP18CS02]|uniref:hypothetical protein n=1 Tax=Streptomyces sp. SP18CS02 TaxID=3002531 RepID=UPI002E790C78|nr:hypothetical protein [Streptomyces sp. SP18CS02]MEE1756065.1 hypothetical protein [Streptomyces sp. SP18CS02]